MNQAFDWVTARAKCNITDLFEKLRAVVEGDVKSAEKNGIDASFEAIATDRFTVRFRNPHPSAQQNDWRTFCLSDTTIEVRGPGDPDKNLLLTAGVSLHDTDCMLEVDGSGRKRLWEFSRLALEPMLFRGR